MSKVSTEFELKNLNPYLQGINAANKATEDFYAKTTSFANFKPLDFASLKPPSVNAPAIDNDLKAAMTQIKLYETERINIAKSNSALAIDLKKTETKSLADEAKAQTRTFKNELNSITGSIKSESAKGSASLSELAGSFGLAFGAAAVAGTGIKFLKDSTSAAFDAERANRKLSAAATEAGLAYGVLAEKNRDFAKSAGLSETAATSITAKITQLATFAGKPQDVDKLQKSFLDLSAAKGIGSNEIDNLIGTILSGQDEGLNRLGISDPGQLYKAYAKSIGTTSDALSQYQKVQAATNAVVEKAAIFTGANADKMNSLSGQSELANAQIENLYTNFGKGLTGSLEFRNGLNLINDVLGSFSTNISEVQTKLGKGLSPRQAAIQEGNKPGNQILDAVGDFVSPIGATLGLAYDVLSDPGQSTKEATDRFLASIGGTHKRRIDTLTQNFEGEQKLIETQNKNAEDQKNSLSAKTFATNFQSQIDSFTKPASDGVEKTRITLEQLNKLQKDFTANIKNFNQSQAELAQKGINTAAKSFYTGSAEDAFKAFNRNPNIADARTDLAALESIKKFIPTEKFEDFKDKFNDFITNDIKKAKEKTEELSRKATDTFDNLFVKSNADNPIASVFAQGTKELDKLKESLKGLSPELQNQAIAIQNKLNADNSFSARLNNKLSAQDLRDDADNFRNFNRYKPDNYQSVIDASLSGKSNPFGFGKTYAQFAQEANGKDPLTKQQQNDVFNVETFNALTRNGVDPTYGIQYLGKVRGAALGTEDLTLQQRLDRKIDLITSSNPVNADQRAIAERALISLTQGIDPSKLTSRERDVAATARENEATRREAYEAKAQTERISQTALQNRIADGIDKLNLIAQKEGFQAVEVILKDQTAAGAEIKKQTKTADRSDVEDHYNLGTNRVGNKLTSF